MRFYVKPIGEIERANFKESRSKLLFSVNLCIKHTERTIERLNKLLKGKEIDCKLDLTNGTKYEILESLLVAINERKEYLKRKVFYLSRLRALIKVGISDKNFSKEIVELTKHYLDMEENQTMVLDL